MNLLEQIIGPFFEQASSVFEALLNIFISFFALGFVVVRTLVTIFS